MEYDYASDPGGDTVANGPTYAVNADEERISPGIPSGEHPCKKAMASSTGPGKKLLDLLTKKVNRDEENRPQDTSRTCWCGPGSAGWWHGGGPVT